jgi:hypothetical protein
MSFYHGGPELIVRCRTGCKTKDHRSYAECLRDAGTRVAYCDSVNGSDATTQKHWDRELDAYRSVRREGIQPEGTTMAKIEHAVRESDKAGAAYGRDFNKATPYEES